MNHKKQKAFTMLELVFVIVVIGILSAVAIPKFAATRDSAVQVKAATTLAAVRNSLATETQKRILKGLFDPITSLHADNSATQMFTFFSDTTKAGASIPQAQREVLQYPVQRGNVDGQWDINGATYTAYLKSGNGCVFTLQNNRLNLTGVAGSSMTLARCQQIFEN